MESNKLNTKEILARRYARGDLEMDPATIASQPLYSPAICVKTVMVDLKPLQASDISLGGIRNSSTESCQTRLDVVLGILTYR